MLKSCLAVIENVNVDNLPKITASKQSKILTAVQVAKLILEAPDEKWLLSKVILIFGIFSTCRSDDLIHLTLEDVECDDRFDSIPSIWQESQIMEFHNNIGCSFALFIVNIII